MKMKHMYKYFISLFLTLILCCSSLFSQKEKKKDSVSRKNAYGLRVGADLSRLVRSFVDDNYTGFELVGDYRVSKRFYAAVELGNEELTVDEDFFNFTSSGSYIKLGFDYNTHNNWFGLRNSIVVGMRYGLSTFSQTLNSFSINNRNQFFGEGGLLGDNEDLLREFDGLGLQWVEAVFGVKAEVLNNLFLSASVRLNFRVSDQASDLFPNLWSPGFNRITDDSSVGIGYNYTLTYFIPFYKKKKKKE